MKVFSHSHESGRSRAMKVARHLPGNRYLFAVKQATTNAANSLVVLILVGAGPTKVAWKDGTRTVPTENFEEGVKPGGTKRFQLELRFSAEKF
jgi:hypothetical protein